MIGCSYYHCFKFVANFVKHFPEIFECFRFWMVSYCLGGMGSAQIHIAQGYHIDHSGFYKFIKHLQAPVTNAHKCNVNFAVGSCYPFETLCCHFGSNSAESKPCRCQSCTPDKFSSCCHVIKRLFSKKIFISQK